MRAIFDIERERLRARIPRKELCGKARVNVSTYRRNLQSKHQPNFGTLQRLDDALRLILAEALQ